MPNNSSMTREEFLNRKASKERGEVLDRAFERSQQCRNDQNEVDRLSGEIAAAGRAIARWSNTFNAANRDIAALEAERRRIGAPVPSGPRPDGRGRRRGRKGAAREAVGAIAEALVPARKLADINRRIESKRRDREEAARKHQESVALRDGLIDRRRQEQQIAGETGCRTIIGGREDRP